MVAMTTIANLDNLANVLFLQDKLLFDKIACGHFDKKL